MRKGRDRTRIRIRTAVVASAVIVCAWPTSALASGAWVIYSSPNASSYDQLTSVTCASTTDCIAVGWDSATSSPGGSRQTLIEEDRGSGWTVVSSPNASSNDQLNGVTCASSTHCIAVGVSAGQTLIEEDTGSGWTVVSSPNASSNDQLNGVTCASSIHCIAAGWYSSSSGGTNQTLIEENTGSGWTVVSSPDVDSNGQLTSVTCASSTDCIAVGWYIALTDFSQTLVEENTGSGWAVVTSANTADDNFLDGVTCASSTHCIAVGEHEADGGDSDTLIEENTGTGWGVVSSPDPGGSGDHLYGVTCASSTDCVAVGSSDGGYPPLIAENTGGGWTVVTSPGEGKDGTQLHGVACASSTVCFAVGWYGVGSTLIEERGLPATLTTSTPSAGSIVIGGSNVDGAVVTGDAADGSPTGSVAFYLCGPVNSEGCPTPSGTVVGSPVALTAGSNDTATASSPPVTPTATGTWCFRAEYLGGGDYAPSVDGSADECFTVVPPTTVDESSPNVSYDGWNGIVDPAANGGTYRASLAKGATASFKFSGTGITWITHKGPRQGIAAVTIDGVKKGNVDLYATSQQSYSKAYSGLTSKSHTIVIKVTGTKNAASSGTSVAVDAFVVGFTTTDDSSSSVQYDTWKGATSSSASGGSYRITATAGATCGVTFTGSRVDWITATGPSAGKASVTIDGVNKGTFDLYASTVNWQVAETFTGLTSGTHSIVVKVLGTKDAAANSANVIIDAFVLYSP